MKVNSPSTSTHEPKHLRKDAAENRERILQAAGEVFAKDGIEASVDDIARVAGVGMGTLYRRFSTKKALIAALVSELLDDVLNDAEQALAPRDGLGLERFLDTSAIHQAMHRGCLSKLWNETSPEKLAHVRQLIAELLKDAQEHGEVRSDVTPSDIFVILWAMKGIIEYTEPVLRNGWRRHLSIVLAGLKPSHVELTHPPLTPRQINAIRANKESEWNSCD